MFLRINVKHKRILTHIERFECHSEPKRTYSTYFFFYIFETNKKRGQFFSEKSSYFSPLFWKIPVDDTELTESVTKQSCILHCKNRFLMPLSLWRHWHIKASTYRLSLVWLFVTLWTVCSLCSQVPLSMGFSRQDYRSGLPFLPPGDLPDPGIEPKSPVSVSCM